MMGSRQIACKSMRSAGVIAVVIASGLLSASSAYAQAGADAVPVQAADVKVHSSGRLFEMTGRGELPGGVWTEHWVVGDPVNTPPLNIRRSLASLDYRAVVVAHETPAPVFQTSPGGHHRSVGRKVAGGAIGALGGFFAGGFLGAKLEGNCRCDDPGLQGFIIGAPVGAVIGGILGAILF